MMYITLVSHSQEMLVHHSDRHVQPRCWQRSSLKWFASTLNRKISVFEAPTRTQTEGQWLESFVTSVKCRQTSQMGLNYTERSENTKHQSSVEMRDFLEILTSASARSWKNHESFRKKTASVGLNIQQRNTGHSPSDFSAPEQLHFLINDSK